MTNPYTDPVKPLTLDELTQSVPAYFKTLKQIAKKPFRFAIDNLRFRSREDFRKALFFISVAFAITFALMAPAFAIKDQVPTKLAFSMRLFGLFALYTMLLHFLLRAFGARSVGWRDTFTVYAHVEGVFLPLRVICFYPIWLLLGPRALFGEFNQIESDLTTLQRHPGFLLYLQLSFFLLMLLHLTLATVWLSRTHNVRKTSSFLSISFLYVFGFLVVPRYINPFLNAWLEKVVAPYT